MCFQSSQRQICVIGRQEKESGKDILEPGKGNKNKGPREFWPPGQYAAPKSPTGSTAPTF